MLSVHISSVRALNFVQVGYFLRDMQQLCNGSASAGLPEWLSGMKVFRSVPSKWPKGMDYHYDGLASPMRFDFANGSISWHQAAYQSGAWKNYDNCLWLGAGSLHLGPKPCLTNPGVNILPLDGQLWMTIDNRSALDLCLLPLASAAFSLSQCALSHQMVKRLMPF